MANKQPVPFRELPLSDSFMFGEVMRNKSICKLFLEELLQQKIAKISYITKEADQKDEAFAHGIRLDVYLADEDNTHYNIEMQNRWTSLERRSRYYQSGIDRHLLESGKDYKALPESIIIFVCNYDHLGLGRPMYERESMYKNTDVRYDDGSHVLVLNTHYTDKTGVSPAIAEYLDYVRDADDSRVFTTELGILAKELTEKVRHNPEKEVFFMTYRQKILDEREDARDEGRAEGLAEGRAEGLAEGRAEGRAEGLAEGLAEGSEKMFAENVKKLLRKMSVEDIAETLEVPIEDVRRVADGKCQIEKRN